MGSDGLLEVRDVVLSHDLRTGVNVDRAHSKHSLEIHVPNSAVALQPGLLIYSRGDAAVLDVIDCRRVDIDRPDRHGLALILEHLGGRVRRGITEGKHPINIRVRSEVCGNGRNVLRLVIRRLENVVSHAVSVELPNYASLAK